MSAPAESPDFPDYKKRIEAIDKRILEGAETKQFLGVPGPTEVKEGDTVHRSKYQALLDAEAFHNRYAPEATEEFRKMMGNLVKRKGFIRIVSQNMHCRMRDTPLVSLTTSPCYGKGKFYDNQMERALGFADLLNEGDAGQVRADIIAIQELQENTVAQEFYEKIREGGLYDCVIDNVEEDIKILGNPFGVGRQIVKGLYNATKLVAKGAGLLALGAGPIGQATGLIALSLVSAIEKREEHFSPWAVIKSGLATLHNPKKLRLVESEVFHFPKQYASGANAIATRGGDNDPSFKGVLFTRYEILTKTSEGTGKYISYFNAHPSPYIHLPNVLPGSNAKSYSDKDIRISHIYQMILIAKCIRSKIARYATAGKKDYVFVGGDMNINKWIQSGQINDETSIDYELRKLYKEEYEEYINSNTEKRKALYKCNVQDPETCAKQYAQRKQDNAIAEIVRKVVEDPQPLVGDYRNNSNIEDEIAAGIESFKQTRDISLKSVFARSDGIVEKCFRDDIPTVAESCDIKLPCCGSEYLTLLETTQGIPPIMLRSLPEKDCDVGAPHGGKYTWDSLYNSVLFSPYWAGNSFQLLDHILYIRHGLIPAYAHTMVRRYILNKPVTVSEGPLSSNCKKEKNITTRKEKLLSKMEYEEPIEPSCSENASKYCGDPHKVYENIYYDVADHYALECCLILDTEAEPIQLDKELAKYLFTKENFKGKEFYRPYMIWPDTYYNYNASLRPEFYPRAMYYFNIVGNSWIMNKIIESCKGTPDESLKDICEYLSKDRTGKMLHLKTNWNTLNTEEISWKNYLPMASEGSEAIKAVHDYARKLFNRMIEMEAINRMKITSGQYIDYKRLAPTDACKKDIRTCVLENRPDYNPGTKRPINMPPERRAMFGLLMSGSVDTITEAKSKSGITNTHSEQAAWGNITNSNRVPALITREGGRSTHRRSKLRKNNTRRADNRIRQTRKATHNRKTIKRRF